jgi:hypothetical protein
MTANEKALRAALAEEQLASSGSNVSVEFFL